MKFSGSFLSDGASIISGNSIIGEKANISDDETDRFEPKMLLFNGLYYRGNWATPFQVNIHLLLKYSFIQQNLAIFIEINEFLFYQFPFALLILFFAAFTQWKQ